MLPLRRSDPRIPHRSDAGVEGGQPSPALPRHDARSLSTFHGPGRARGMGFERRHAYGPDGFGYALGDLRTAIGVQLAAILSQFPMKVEAGLLQILPPEDLEDESPSGWIPGFDELQGQ